MWLLVNPRFNPLSAFSSPRRNKLGGRFLLLLSVIQEQDGFDLPCVFQVLHGDFISGCCPHWFAGERLEALLGKCKEMPLWALDCQFV